MASRESQGLQIALILFVMVTVVLAVTTYIYFRKSEEKIKLAKAAQEAAKTAGDVARGLEWEKQMLMHVLGAKRLPDAELNEIKKGLVGNKDLEPVIAQYDKDMKTYGVGFAGQDLSYRSLPEHLITTLNNRNKMLADADVIQKKLEAERAQVAQAEAARAKKAEDQMQVAQASLADERQKFNDDRGRLTAQTQQLPQKLTEAKKELDTVTTTMQAEKEKLQQQLTQTAQMLETVNQKLAAIKEDTFETADGVVTWVNQRANIVWIDLGFSDGLQKMMTFSVIDRDETGVTKGKVKGRIEVTQLKDAHLAEARIVDVDLSDPILPGDQVYSPSFRKGQKTRFALAGLLDMDRDGKSDQEKVKALIRTNGGEVDAELKEDGKIEGKMTIDTKYLVKGDRPTDKTNQELIKGYTQIIQKATELGIESISLETLLDRMGYFPENRVIPMSGEGSATPAGAGAPGAPSGAGGAAQPFRPRTAPSGATN